MAYAGTPAGQIDGMRASKTSGQAMAALGPAPAYHHTASSRLTLDAPEIPAFRQIVTMPPLTLPVAGVAYNVNASLGTTGFLGADAGGVDEPDPPVHCFRFDRVS